MMFASFSHVKKSTPSVFPRGGLNPRCHPDLSLFLRITARPVAAYCASASKLRSHVPRHSAAAFHLLQLSWRILPGTHSFIACTWHYTLPGLVLSRFSKMVQQTVQASGSGKRHRKTVAAIHSHGGYSLVRSSQGVHYSSSSASSSSLSLVVATSISLAASASSSTGRNSSYSSPFSSLEVTTLAM